IRSSSTSRGLGEVYKSQGKCIAPSEMNVYESNKKAILSWSDECFTEDGFVGFNLYRNGEQIGEEQFVNVRYTDEDVELGTEYIYRLEAFYNTSCVASDTVKITLTGKGAAREPAAFNVEGTETADKDIINAKATWGLPYFEEPMAYGYCGVPAGTDLIKESSQVFCIVGWSGDDMGKFADDLYLVGVEFMLGAASSSRAINSLSTIVYVNNNLVYNKPYEERFQAREWVRVYFDRVFKMRQRSEIAVGYSVSYNPGAVGQQEGIFVFDMGPRTKSKSDLIALDGKDFGTLYAISQGVYDVNFCINALVVRLRDLADAASAVDPKEYLMSKAMRMDLKAELASERKLTDAPKTSSEGLKLKGFNIYRDGKKLNENLMTETSYEENVARGEYEYVVGAVYEGAEEQKATIFADFTTVGVEDLEQAYGVSVYPNPTSDLLNIKGDYVSFMLVDMSGRVLMRDVRNTESVSLAGLNNGVYFVLITLPNGDKRAVKVIKR
ncbi:MAG: T9SS type A sorting domain-containing protein, partial [Bacteroidales bacterium]|nr:T9SS type A sorting domain-containing protein [Bacteroidales bacterium]